MATDPSSSVHTSREIPSSWLENPLEYSVRAYIAFLQTIFEEAPVGCFHWRPTTEDTELVITEDTPVKLDTVERKPVISVLLGGGRWNGSSLDDLVNVKITNAEETHTDLIPTNITMNCMSRVPREARHLAWLVMRNLWILRKLFVAESHIHEANRNTQFTALSPAGALVQGDAEHEWVNMSVTAPLFLQWTDRVTPLKHDWNGRPIHALQDVSMRFQTRMAQQNLTHNQEAGLTKGLPLWGERAAQTRTNSRIRRQALLKPPSIRGKTINTGSTGLTSVPISHQTKV